MCHHDAVSIVGWRGVITSERAGGDEVCPPRAQCLEICLEFTSMSAFPSSDLSPIVPTSAPWHTSTCAEITISSIPNCILLGTVFHLPGGNRINKCVAKKLDTDLGLKDWFARKWENPQVHYLFKTKEQKSDASSFSAVLQINEVAKGKQIITDPICLCSCVNVLFVM